MGVARGKGVNYAPQVGVQSSAGIWATIAIFKKQQLPTERFNAPKNSHVKQIPLSPPPPPNDLLTQGTCPCAHCHTVVMATAPSWLYLLKGPPPTLLPHLAEPWLLRLLQPLLKLLGTFPALIHTWRELAR